MNATNPNPNFFSNRYLTKEELNELLTEKEIEKGLRDDERKESKYLRRITEYKGSDEMYLRETWESLMENNYDGSTFEGIFEEQEEVNLRKKWVNLTKLDSKTRGYKPINLLKFILQLCSVNDIRQLVYNNSWGFVVREPKKSNYPEKTVLHTLKDIIEDGLNTPNIQDKGDCLKYLDLAPYDSLAHKIWSLFPTIENMKPVCATTNIPIASGAYECLMSRMTNELDDTEEIPEEDRDFWKGIYSTRKHLTYGKEFKVVS